MFVDIFNTNKKYQVIYADPPWQYNNKRTGGSMNSGSASKYPVLSLEKLAELPEPSIASKDSVLFLWTTVPLLQEGIILLNMWGYKYKTSLFWRKIMSLGMGFWFRGQVEMCLLGVRGHVKPFRLQKTNFLQTKALRHSEKPEDIRHLIELTGLLPRIELFARQQVDGWDCWGNEVSPSVGATKLEEG